MNIRRWIPTSKLQQNEVGHYGSKLHVFMIFLHSIYFLKMPILILGGWTIPAFLQQPFLDPSFSENKIPVIDCASLFIGNLLTLFNSAIDQIPYHHNGAQFCSAFWATSVFACIKTITFKTNHWNAFQWGGSWSSVTLIQSRNPAIHYEDAALVTLHISKSVAVLTLIIAVLW